MEVESCKSCLYFQKILNDKEKEIQELKLNIKKLTELLSARENESTFVKSFNDSQDEKGETFIVQEVEIRQLNELRKLENCEDKCATEESKIFPILKTVETQTTESESCLKDHRKDPTFEKKEQEKPETENANFLDDYVYDENYQLYYSHSSGYYFDQAQGVFFEPKTGVCYRYDYSSQEYESVSSNDYNSFHKILETSCENVVKQVNSLNINDDMSTTENFSAVSGEPSIYSNENSKEPLIEDNCLSPNHEENSDINANDAADSTTDWQLPSGTNMTVHDLVKEVVEQHCGMSDYIYDESSHMYYSPSTGYYYDSVRQLLYDPSCGIYYRYDSENQSYEFYSQLNLNDYSSVLTKNCKQKARKAYWKNKIQQKAIASKNIEDDEKTVESSDEFSSPEEGEIFSSNSDSELTKHSTDSGIMPYSKESHDLYVPCIRAIVECSEKLKVGSLLLITCKGGIIGRDKESSVHIPDSSVSKFHAEVKYNEESRKYSVEDLGSQKGTFVNDSRLSEPKEKSLCYILSHGDRLSLGSCQLLLHIHIGFETCDKCEPGQVLAELSQKEEKPVVFKTKEEKEKERRNELKNIKKKYGLQGMSYTNDKITVVKKGYEDKAELRRQTVGSENPYEKNVESSMDAAMPVSNKGYQMLQKMGWKEGESLGAQQNTGILEPIPLRPWTTKAGLGCPSELTSAQPVPANKRNRKWVKAQERYLKLS